MSGKRGLTRKPPIDLSCNYPGAITCTDKTNPFHPDYNDDLKGCPKKVNCGCLEGDMRLTHQQWIDWHGMDRMTGNILHRYNQSNNLDNIAGTNECPKKIDCDCMVGDMVFTPEQFKELYGKKGGTTIGPPLDHWTIIGPPLDHWTTIGPPLDQFGTTKRPIDLACDYPGAVTCTYIDGLEGCPKRVNCDSYCLEDDMKLTLEQWKMLHGKPSQIQLIK
jgi:hypothetical protein